MKITLTQLNWIRVKLVIAILVCVMVMALLEVL